MRATTRSKRASNGGTPLVSKTVSYTALGLACLFLLAMAVHLPASSSNSVSLDASFVHRSSAVAGQRELLDVKEDTASSGRSFLQYQTRRNWAAEDVSPRFCSYDDAKQECDWSNYAQSLSLLAMPPAVIGIFFFVFYIVIFLVRCCCISARCCMLPWTGSSIEPWIMRILLLSIAVMILGMAVMAHVGNAWAHEGVNDLVDDSANYAKTIVNLTNQAADLLVRLDSSQQGTADTAKSDASDVQSNIDDFKDILDKVETARFVVFLFTFIIIFGIGISALFSICCFRRPTFCTNYCYALALFVPIIVVMTFCIVFGAAASDVCTAYDEAKVNSTDNLFSEILGSSWGVDCAALQDLVNPLLNESSSTVNELCTQYNQTCASNSDVSGCQPCSSTANIDLLKQTNYTEKLYCSDSPNVCPTANQTICSTDPNAMCYQQTLTFEACVTECLSANSRAVANETIYYVDLYDELNSTLTDILPYVGCGLITQFVEATDYGLCVEFIAGDFLVVVATIALGFLWIFYEFVVLLAFERAGFQPDKDDDYGL